MGQKIWTHQLDIENNHQLASKELIKKQKLLPNLKKQSTIRKQNN